MGVTERKEREKLKRLETILIAAEQVFAEKGIEAATVNDVAQAAELGKGTLYLYFTGKEDLIMALCHEAILHLQEAFAKSNKKNDTGVQKLRALGLAYFDFCKANPVKYHLLNFYRVKPISETATQTPCISKCHESSQQIIGYMVSIIKEGIEDKSISKYIDPFTTAFMLWACTTGVYQLVDTLGEHLEADHGLSRKKFVSYYFDFIESNLQNFKPL
jgi:TetR/AcrR family transcriptional regulator